MKHTRHSNVLEEALSIAIWRVHYKRSGTCGLPWLWVAGQHPSFELLRRLYGIYFSNCHHTLVGGQHCANSTVQPQVSQPRDTQLWREMSSTGRCEVWLIHLMTPQHRGPKGHLLGPITSLTNDGLRSHYSGFSKCVCHILNRWSVSHSMIVFDGNRNHMANTF